jgi:deoxyadenosine/deoxycytidine kinase
MYYDLVFYLNPGVENIIKYKEKRAREIEEKVDSNYLKKIHNIYEENINEIYPDNIHFDSSISLDKYNSVFEMYYKSGILPNVS